jgi:hypothetical protein
VIEGVVTAPLAIGPLMAAAGEVTGLEDFGGPEFVARAERWFAAIEAEAGLSGQGRAMLAQVVTGWLLNRLRLVADLKHHPEIAAQVVREPLFVTGLPRTGTTKLQRMLARDPALQSLPFWLLLNPAPVPGADGAAEDPRIGIAQGYIEQLAAGFPDFMTAHPAFVDEPEEESFLIETDFHSQACCTRVRVPSFWASIRDDAGRESLGFLRAHLRYFQWQRGAGGGRPWVLKSPLHIGVLEALYEQFPDAIVVHAHRDPRVVLPSIARITEVWRAMACERIDLHALGAEMLAIWAWLVDRYLLARDRLGPGRIIDVSYDEICTAPVDLIGRIYDAIGRELTPAAIAAMRGWEAAHPQHEFGRHAYSLERYGLTIEQIDEAFRAYTDRFAAVLGSHDRDTS